MNELYKRPRGAIMLAAGFQAPEAGEPHEVGGAQARPERLFK
jgi:hypothetical protein